MAFLPFNLAVLDAFGAHVTRNLHTLCVAPDASRQQFIPQPEHGGKRADSPNRLRRC